MFRPRFPSLLSLSMASGLLAALAGVAGCGGPAHPTKEELRTRGEYLVSVMLCADCHTPWHEGPNGPEPNPARHLSGHPETLVMPPAPQMNAPEWGGAFAATNTAWSGPWGVSFTANLTPDPETGLGKWSYETFRDTLRNGRHEGRGRLLLPPMPALAIGGCNDHDLLAIYTYLQSITPIRNRVPEPVAPVARTD